MAPSAQHPIDLYYWPTPNGWKITIMLEECGLPYNAHAIDIGAGDQFKPEFLGLSPNNKIPAIVDRDTGASLMESGAILLYLAEKTGKFIPQDGPGRWMTWQWLMFQMGGAGPMLGQAHYFLQFNPGKAPHAEERFGKEARRLYTVMDKRLGEAEYLAGDDYTIADIAVWPWYGALAQGELYEAGEFLQVRQYTHLQRWTAEIAARPAVQRGRRVNRIRGEPSAQMPERHDASDFDPPPQATAPASR